MYAHCDLDCFFVSVERLLDPSLNGVPVGAVGGGDPEGRRGIVIAASYEARPYGVRTGTPVFEAVRLCPQIRLVPAYGPYGRVSVAVERILRRFFPEVVRRSIDEFDCPLGGWVETIRRRYRSLEAFARRVQGAVWGEVGVPMSIGISSSPPIAKLVTKSVKPFGVGVVEPAQVPRFVDRMEVDEIAGIAKGLKRQLARAGIRTLGELAAIDPRIVRARFSVVVERLCRCVRGEDIPLPESSPFQQQMGHHRTFPHPSSDPNYLHAFLEQLARQLCFRLRRDGYLALHLAVSLRLEDFTERWSEVPLAPTSLDEHLVPVAHRLLERLTPDRPTARGVGVWCGRIIPGPRQPSLFESPELYCRERLARALDRVREKFGWDAVLPASTLAARRRARLKRLSCAFNVRSQPDLLTAFPPWLRQRVGV